MLLQASGQVLQTILLHLQVALYGLLQANIQFIQALCVLLQPTRWLLRIQALRQIIKCLLLLLQVACLAGDELYA